MKNIQVNTLVQRRYGIYPRPFSIPHEGIAKGGIVNGQPVCTEVHLQWLLCHSIGTETRDELYYQLSGSQFNLPVS